MNILNKIIKLLYLPIAITILITILVIQKFILVRFMYLDFDRIGNFYYIDWYLTEKKLGKYDNKVFDIFYERKVNEPNKFWSDKWRQKLFIFKNYDLVSLVVKLINFLPNKEIFLIPKNHVYPSNKEYQISRQKIKKNDIYYTRLSYILRDYKSNIDFNKNEISKGNQLLLKLGLPSGQKYICFHARDSKYLNVRFPKKNWTYHNYRDSNINNYILAINELTKKNLFGIRMGQIVKDDYQTSNKKIIDYSKSKIKSDFLDVYISAKCKFFICSDCGISSFPEAFKVPAVYTNWVPIRRISTWVLNGIFIFKKIYSNKKKRLLFFSEIIDMDTDSINVRKKLGLEIIENTPEEIRDTCIEMNMRIDGEWIETDEDKKNQFLFWSLFEKDYLKSKKLLIGAKFLRDNANLIK